MSTAVGQPIPRLDGFDKVTGRAQYAADYPARDLVHGFVVSSTIACGRIRRIDADAARALPGVIDIITHENAPRLARSDSGYEDEVGPPGSPFCPLYDDRVRFSMQPIGLVVAETPELARYAESLLRIEYETTDHVTDPESARTTAAYSPEQWRVLPPLPKPRGNVHNDGSAASIDAEYRMPFEHHNPMELFGTTVVCEVDGRLTVYDKTQGVQNVHGYLCMMLGRDAGDIRVIAPYVGGAFGAGLRPQYCAYLAALAAQLLKRSVRVTLTRQQMFSLGYRPYTWQRVALGAARDGTLESLVHYAVATTSRYEDYTEKVLLASGRLYRCDSLTVDYKVVKLDLQTPIDMRAPGAATGMYALECAMDELAFELGMDPLELRLRNYTEFDQDAGVPFSSKKLRECYQQGADRFGWSRRNPVPGSMRDGDTLIGWGMATGLYDALQVPASARCVLNPDGTATVSSATADIGTGTRTIMTQIAADALGLPVDRVTFEYADSTLPQAPVEGDSFTATSVGAAVRAACERARALPGDGVRQAEASTGPSDRRKHFECFCHSAVFAEVGVDAELGTIHVLRVVNAVAGGRILNPVTARSQVIGGIVWGIGMALTEESVLDRKFGRFINHNYAEYHVPVNADIHDIDVIFIEEQDDIVSPIGAKGLGEIGVVGVAAAIANAVFHATGQRIRDLPITLDKLLPALA